MKKITALVLLVIFLLISFVTPILAIDSSENTILYANTYSEYMENVEESNSLTADLLDYVSDEEGNLPDYYGGTSYAPNGELEVHLTECDDAVLKDIMTRFPSCNYKMVEYSINDLIDLKNSFINTGTDFEKIVINTYTNSVDIYLKSQSDLLQVEELLSNTANKTAYKFYVYDSNDSILEKSTGCVPELIYSEEEIAAYEEAKRTNENLTESNSATRDTLTIKPGTGYTISGSGDPDGTIGVCAILNSGSYVVITHGHGLARSNPIFIGSTRVGNVAQVYNNGYIGYDFSYTVVSSNYVSSDLAVGSDSLSSTYTESQLSSMGVIQNAYFIGNSTGSPNRYTLSSVQLTTSGKGSTYPYLSLSRETSDGDSGGPIYYNTSSNTVFLGIIKGNSTSEGVGVPASTIKNTIGLYYYFN